MISISRQKNCKCFDCGKDIILLQNGSWSRKLDPKQMNFWMKKNGNIVVAESMKYGKWDKTFGYKEHDCPGKSGQGTTKG